ncbi:MAG: hypothetical protein EBZ74_12860, partial [Planctomycetia bacterium]|nr:hypothetical protein [Planctomycetia bacterium]
MASSRKPRPLDLTPNADISIDPRGVSLDQAAQCDQWECDMDGSGTYECGRTVRVPAVVFDEGDAKKIRKLAEWLQMAA